MLGTTGGRFLGPSGSQPHRNLWPLHSGRGLDFQTNGEGAYKQLTIIFFNVDNMLAGVYFQYRFQYVVFIEHILFCGIYNYKKRKKETLN